MNSTPGNAPIESPTPSTTETETINADGEVISYTGSGNQKSLPPAHMAPVLAAAIVKAQKTARAVGKDSKNKHHGYKYASAEAIIEESKECLAAADLGLFPERWNLVRDDAGRRIFVTHILVHTSGVYKTIETSTPVVPEKGRPEDKAEMGALTQNLAYTLRGLLLLAREDQSTSVETRDDRDYRREDRGRDDDRGGRSERRSDGEPPDSNDRREEREGARHREETRNAPRREPGDDRDDRGGGGTPFDPPPEPDHDLAAKYIDQFRKLEADFGLADGAERKKILGEMGRIVEDNIVPLTWTKEELKRMNDVFNPIQKAMKAALGVA